MRDSTVRTAMFALSSNLYCIEAHASLSKLRMVSKPGEGAAVSKSHTSGKPFTGFYRGVHNGNVSAELTSAVSRNRV